MIHILLSIVNSCLHTVELWHFCSDNQLVTIQDRVVALQAELVAQRSVFQGFAAQLTGCALQAELSSMLGQWHDKGMAMGAAQCRIYGPQSSPQ